MAAGSRSWTLETARNLLSEVRSHTAEAVVEVERMAALRDAAAEGSEERTRLEQELAGHISRWVRAMEALGVDVKGLWLVDFDNGNGCYCWRWPEQELDFFHGYDEGFAGRTRIQ
jgi:hypothetical protein